MHTHPEVLQTMGELNQWLENLKENRPIQQHALGGERLVHEKVLAPIPSNLVKKAGLRGVGIEESCVGSCSSQLHEKIE